MPYSSIDQKREYHRNWVAKRKALFFADKVCAKCDGTENLELDHIDPAQKISHRIWSWSLQRRTIELAKCQILCNVCHKVKSATEKACGQAVTISKLTSQKVIQIRQQYHDGVSKRSLGRQFNVDEKNIRLIVNGQIWRHVA